MKRLRILFNRLTADKYVFAIREERRDGKITRSAVCKRKNPFSQWKYITRLENKLVLMDFYHEAMTSLTEKEAIDRIEEYKSQLLVEQRKSYKLEYKIVYSSFDKKLDSEIDL